jgi:NTE family protein
MHTAAFLRNVPVLAGLSDELLERLASQVNDVRVRAGTWIMRAGESADSMFIVRSGRLEVIEEGPSETLIRILRRGDVLGELALLRDDTRSASVRARRDAELIELGRAEFEALIKEAPSFALGLLRAMGERLAASRTSVVAATPPRTIAVVGHVNADQAPALGDAARVVLAETEPHEAVGPPRRRPRRTLALDMDEPTALRAESATDFLARTPLFSDIDPELHKQLAATSHTRHLEAGQWLFREHEPGDAMYVVRAGRLEVVDEAAGTVIRELGRGDTLGELAVLTDSPRSASVRAARATDVIALDQADFEELLHCSPALSLALNRSLGRQLRDTRAPAPTARPRPTTVALTALDAKIPLPRLADRLRAALEGHLSVAVLGDAGRSAPAGPGEPATVYGPLLDRAEAGHDLVLLVGGLTLQREPWMKFCLQQADRVLAVTGGGPVPQVLGEFSELQACDLVAYDAAPRGLDGWAAALHPVESHVIRETEFGADIARTARRLSGTSVGIVLSGGGARAFSHIGVLEELTAAGLTIDRIVGVSMGAVIGALFAMGHDADEMDAICFEEWVQRRPLSDYTVPRHSLIRGERFRSMLHRTFGTCLIEELPRSFICGSAELRSGRLEIARYGPLWEAVSFSICLPIIAPPQVRGREMFIDGSLVDNLPVKAMADMGEGPIIAVDVKATFERSKDGPAAARTQDNRPPRPPSLGETLTRVLLLGSENTTEAARRYADLLIKPRAEGVGLLEFHQLDTAREAGRVAAREALERAPAGLFA